MEQKYESSFLREAIKSITLLTNKNSALWRQRVENLIELMGLTNSSTEPDGQLSETYNIRLKTLLISKLDATIHAKVINKKNCNSAKEIW